jgi:cytochrome c553
LAFATISAPAFSAPSSQLAWSKNARDTVQHGDPTKGKQIAEACGACHAPGTQPPDGKFPLLQGQLATYLYKQLRDYKDGSRTDPVMSGVASGLADKDMADVAAWYASQPLPNGTRTLAQLAAAEKLVHQGDGKRILPPCRVCHEPDGRGQRIDVPALTGQNPAYTEQTLQNYRSGARHNDLYARMRTISEQLSDEEIKQLARYYAGLGR